MSEEPKSVDGSSGNAFQCGYIGLIGRPNAGKSTLLNQVLGQKVSITSRKPQTTRNRVAGIFNAPDVQAILVDTPGHHDARSELNQRMVKVAESALSDVDVVLLIVDLVPAVRQARAGREILSAGEVVLADLVMASGKPCILALNKTDLVDVQWILPVIDTWRQRYEITSVVPFSAIKGDGVKACMEAAVEHLPEHPPFFPVDQLTDSSERFVVSEIVREKLFHLLDKELPYAVAVEIEAFNETTRKNGDAFVKIHARIVVERKSQKGIVIGKGGQMLKRVGTLARKDIQRLLGCAVHLELFVAVEKGWTQSPRLLRQFGYD